MKETAKKEQTLCPEITNQIITSLYKKDLHTFARKAFEIISPHAKYIEAQYIHLINEHLKNCATRDIKRFIINIPPRHLKSISVNVIFPAWILGNSPGERILTATYSYKLLREHSTSFLRLVTSEWYKSIFPKTVIQNSALDYVSTTLGGARFATTVGGQITGAGGNYIIIDDPLNAAAADSSLKREEVQEWYRTACSTRKDSQDAVIILVAQRLHDDDLCGYLLKTGEWQLLKLPAIAEEDECHTINGLQFRRRKGELLSPKRFSVEALEETRQEVGAYNFAAQYQQSPVPTEGGEFKKEWLQYYTGCINDKDENMTKFILCDPANSKKESADYTAIFVLGLGTDRVVRVLDIVRDRLSLIERGEMIFQLNVQYKPKLTVYEHYSMQGDIEYLKYLMDKLNYFFQIKAVGGTLKNVDRIRRLQSLFAEGRVLLPETLIKMDCFGKRRDLIKEFVDEYLRFPKGNHDDMMDCLSRIFDIFPGNNIIFPKGGIDFSKLLQKVV